MTSALLGVALVAGWGAGPWAARWLWLGDEDHPPATRPVRAAAAAVAVAVALLVLYRLSGRGPVAGQGLNLTAVVLLLLLAWTVRLQAIRAGRSTPAPPERAVRVTSAVLAVLALALAVPDLFLMSTR
jgi:hypothetical protein